MKIEIIFIVLLILFFCLFLYWKFPRYKYNRALKLITDCQYDKAIFILQSIFYKIPEAPFSIAECKLKLGLVENIEISAARKYFNDILNIKGKLGNESNKELYEIIEAKAIFEIHKLNFKEISQNKSLKENDKIQELKKNLVSIKETINSLNKIDYTDLLNEHRKKITELFYDIVVMKSVDAKCLRNENKLEAFRVYEENILFIDKLTDEDKHLKQNLFKNVREKQILELFDYYFQIGLTFERKNKFNEAIEYYDKAKLYLLKYELSTQVYNDIVARIEICKLKNGTDPDESIFYLITDSNKNYKNDFFYRLAVKKLKEKKYNYAEKIINSNFTDIDSQDIDNILKIINNNKIKVLDSKKDKLNADLEILTQVNFPINETESFYSNLKLLIEESQTLLPSLSDKLNGLKPSIFNRLLTGYIDSERHNDAIELVTNYPNYFENVELIKNLAICCLSFANNNILNENNFKNIISSGLTAIHIDKVIISSIEKTSWDDDYTFTLFDSLGGNISEVGGEIPHNINFDEPSASNISIGSTQRDLLTQFEGILNSKQGTDNFSNIQEFYENEKNALQKLISVNPDSQYHTAPYFSKCVNLNECIIQELNNAYEDKLDESILEAGIPYLSDNSSSFVRTYSDAKIILDKIINSINRLNLTDLKNLYNDVTRYKINNFYNLSDELEDLAFDALRKKIDTDSENEEILRIMEYLIYFMNDNDKLLYQYSNTVLSMCITKVNNGKMTNFQALEYVYKAFLSNPDHTKICESLAILVNFNLNDLLGKKNVSERDLFKILDAVYENRSFTFVKSAQKELLPSRNLILNSLRKSGVDTSVFEGYVSSNNLSIDGMRMKIVLNYFKKLSYEIF